MGCFKWLILIGGFVFMMASLLRWFEQTMEAVDERDWGRLTVLIVFPFAVWRYPSRVGAGRPTAVPIHEPVRGFGKVPLTKPGAITGPPASAGGPSDGPPPKKTNQKPPAQADQIARLKQRMIEQGMLKPPDEEQ